MAREGAELAQGLELSDRPLSPSHPVSTCSPLPSLALTGRSSVPEAHLQQLKLLIVLRREARRLRAPDEHVGRDDYHVFEAAYPEEYSSEYCRWSEGSAQDVISWTIAVQSTGHPIPAAVAAAQRMCFDLERAATDFSAMRSGGSASQ
jgi:hypothetical protein